MPICNLLIKTTRPATTKFILQLDSPSLRALRTFQIVPSNQFGFDFVGKVTGNVIKASDDPRNELPCFAYDPNTNSCLFIIALFFSDDDPNIGKFGLPGSFVVGMQGTGLFEDMTRGIELYTENMLLWKVVSISGQPPPSWGSMDIFQDLPAPSGDSAVV
jgi:hypothetical protein